MELGNVGIDFNEQDNAYHFYNSGLVISPEGERIGRYDKIYLVSYGEYIPFQRFMTFAHKITGRVSSLTPGAERKFSESMDIITGSSFVTKRFLPTRFATLPNSAARSL